MENIIQNRALLIRIVIIFFIVIFGWLSLMDLRAARVTIEWSTATELNTVGFDIYRSIFPDGQREKINQSTIPSSADALIGSRYSFVDEDVSAGTVYYYWLEDVDLSGSRTLHGPINVRATGRVGINAVFTIILIGMLVLHLLNNNPPREHPEGNR